MRHHLSALAIGLVLAASPARAQETGEGFVPADPPPPPPPAETQPPAEPPQPQPRARADRESVCDDRRDDDGDGMVDCADADCFENTVCDAGGESEENNDRCSDWIDNDGDGAIDCDDDSCSRPGVTVCRGSMSEHGGAHADPSLGDEDLPELTGDMTAEDLIGNFGDVDGERNDFVCSDGIDNDGDGRTDCADFGCRFDRSVTVCHGNPSIHFSVVAGAGFEHDFESETSNVRFSRLQLRALGPIPLINNSFFLLSARFERSPRLTFAHFQIPIGDTRLYAAFNSGFGGLSHRTVASTAKQLLLDPPFYLTRAFEQGTGAALEMGGPIDLSNRLHFRVFAAGGSGEFNGNVGGRFFRSDDRNFSYTVGGQLQINLVGNFDRFDTPFIFTPVPATLGMFLGAKYDQRPRERYPAFNAFLLFRYWHFILRAESYTKRELEYGSWQTAWNAEMGVLLWPRRLVLAADIGSFYATEFDDLPDGGFDSALRRPLDELQWRVALHFFYYRDIGLLSLVYSDTDIERNPDRPEDPTRERELSIEAQFRF